ALTSSVTSSWPGGYQLQLTVTDTGSTPLTGWTAGFSFADTAETVTNSWNATVTQTGRQVSAANAGYDGSVPAGGSTTFGMVVSGTNHTLSSLTCAAA
ncbi:MAG: cellulose binding domain-containing protein, partial [Streptosporangiaceae bacterium]|nr:cellulose binding domain-containing protein [Streptosporangiaceae bacterium]